MSRALSGDAYDPERFVRGEVDGRDGDGVAFKGSRQPVHGLRLQVAGGFVSIPYGMHRGFPWMDTAATMIEMPVEGFHRHEGVWKLQCWLVTIKGKRLATVFDYLNGAKGEWGKPSPEDRDQYPEIESVVIEPLAD